MNEPPRCLSNDPNHRDFHPSLLRVGVRIDGEERDNISWYDAERCLYKTVFMSKNETPLIATSIEPYWRFEETRQQRRARERWEQR